MVDDTNRSSQSYYIRGVYFKLVGSMKTSKHLSIVKNMFNIINYSDYAFLLFQSAPFSLIFCLNCFCYKRCPLHGLVMEAGHFPFHFYVCLCIPYRHNVVQCSQVATVLLLRYSEWFLSSPSQKRLEKTLHNKPHDFITS